MPGEGGSYETDDKFDRRSYRSDRSNTGGG